MSSHILVEFIADKNNGAFNHPSFRALASTGFDFIHYNVKGNLLLTNKLFSTLWHFKLYESTTWIGSVDKYSPWIKKKKEDEWLDLILLLVEITLKFVHKLTLKRHSTSAKTFLSRAAGRINLLKDFCVVIKHYTSAYMSSTHVSSMCPILLFY